MPDKLIRCPRLTCRHRPTCRHGVAAHPAEVRCHLKPGSCPSCQPHLVKDHYRTSTGAAVTSGAGEVEG